MAAYDSLSSIRAAMTDVFNSVNPYVAQRNLQGIIAETTPRYAVIAGGLMVSGTVYYVQVYLFRGQVLATTHIVVGTAGSGVTFGKVGLYDSTGVLLASTADQTNGWTAVGTHSQAFAVAYTVPVTGIYYAALLTLASPTAPSPGISSTPQAGNIGNGGAAPSGGLVCASQTGQTDLPAPATIAAGTAPGVFWVGFS